MVPLSVDRNGDGHELSVPEFLSWTGDWDVESERAGKEYSAGKTVIEVSMARLYMIWLTECWRSARSPRVVDSETGEIVSEGSSLFSDFSDVTAWFEEKWGFARSTVYDHIQTYERMRQIGLPLEASMATMAQVQMATKELIAALFQFEPRTNRLLGVNQERARDVNIPNLEEDTPLDAARDVVSSFVIQKLDDIQSGKSSRGEVSAEIQHEVLRKPVLFCYKMASGDIDLRWSYPGNADGTNEESGSIVLKTGALPPTVRDIVMGRLHAR